MGYKYIYKEKERKVAYMTLYVKGPTCGFQCSFGSLFFGQWPQVLRNAKFNKTHVINGIIVFTKLFTL